MEPTLYISDVTAAPGSTVQVAVCVKGNPGILGVAMTVTYDESVLTMTGATKGAIASGLEMTKPGAWVSGCSFLYDGMDEIDAAVEDGEILILTFAVEASASGTCEIGLTFDYAVDINLKPVVFATANGFVTVAG